ncbi:MAG: efflux RND transporter periplasmic adaptor subunit, partial [Candidatus Eisenbacteria sp.]|nr:efflux RND transporter periplasmic adaptor subunit [Candidatus Eisenbacteria bacterium]
QWNLETAEAQHDQATANGWAYQHELKIAEIGVEQAEAELERLKKGVDPVLAIQVQQAQQALGRLKESSQIVAPVDGEVISLSLYPGRPVEPFRTVIVVADPSAIEVSASPSDDELKDLTEGQEATIALSINPDRSWTGTIRRLPYPYGTGGSVGSPGGLDNSTRIRLEGDLGELNLGNMVRVTIVLEEKDETLWLPPDALRSFQDQYFVIVQDSTGQRRVDVELGIGGQDQVEILKGLEENQVVVAP